MAFTDALDVDIGDPTKASDYDTLADNPEWLRTKNDVDHNFDISTGTGYHKAAHTAPLHMYNGSNHVVMWWDFTDTAKPIFRALAGVGSVPTPSAVNDPLSFIVQMGTSGGTPTF